MPVPLRAVETLLAEVAALVGLPPSETNMSQSGGGGRRVGYMGALPFQWPE